MDPMPAFDEDDERWPKYKLSSGRMVKLPKLSQIEQMLIALVHVIQKVYRLSNGQLGYQGQVLNVEQDISELVEKVCSKPQSLPHFPEDLPMMIVRKIISGGEDGELPQYKDFKCNRFHIRLWLEWLKENNPLYANIQINYRALDSLPTNGNLVGRLPVVEESAKLKETLDAAT